jgi:hypothetical protein
LKKKRYGYYNADGIVLKELKPIVGGQAFGLHEMISKSKINSNVI